MALSGSLSDLSVMELIQVPAAGRKTGELIIAGLEHDARLFFIDGKLVHLTMDEMEGEKVLTEVLRWSEGMFEFRLDVLTENVTFDKDLGQVITMAVQTHITTTMVNGGASVLSDAEAARIHELLDDQLRSYDYLVHVSMISPVGPVVLASATTNQSIADEMAGLVTSICSAARMHPRPSLHRLLLEDGLGTVAASCLDEERVLVLVADRSAKIGAVSMCLDRLARRIAGEDE